SRYLGIRRPIAQRCRVERSANCGVVVASRYQTRSFRAQVEAARSQRSWRGQAFHPVAKSEGSVCSVPRLRFAPLGMTNLLITVEMESASLSFLCPCPRPRRPVVVHPVADHVHSVAGCTARPAADHIVCAVAGLEIDFAL